MKRAYDAVVIGGGAAGLFCAIEAGKRHRRVLVLERNAQPGRKIIISGGGRCNFTNLHTAPENFISRNPHFAKSALARYTPSDFVQLVKKHRIEFYEKKLGQLFCRDSSRAIVDMLLKECSAARVDLLTNCTVTGIEHDGKFRISTTSGSTECESLVVATGGLSFPKVGATDFGYAVARQFGLKIEPTRPSLVPLIFRSERHNKLAGVSVDAAVSTEGQTFRENVLFTHRGLSGPATLQISNYWQEHGPVEINLLPELDLFDELTSNTHGNRTVSTVLRKLLPERLVESFLPEGLLSQQVSHLTTDQKNQLAAKINAWLVNFSNTEGYDRAEVTLGGVATGELSSQTMEARRVEGLYFIGEVVDVTGWLGGYNFQWAWSSGYAAGQVI